MQGDVNLTPDLWAEHQKIGAQAGQSCKSARSADSVVTVWEPATAPAGIAIAENREVGSTVQE